jgi:hypothetical protein
MNDAAPLIISALFAGPDQAWFDELRAEHFPRERNHLAAHLTLFHQLPPSLLDECRRRLADATGAPPPAARLAGLMNLGGGTAIRIHAPGLEEIRGALADAFSSCLTAQDRNGWRPHVTVQNKVRSSEAAALQTRLFASLTERPVRLAALALWKYRGGPWELVSRHPFRA